MLVIVSYDVSTQNAAGRTRLRKIAKICVNYGQRVQNSVFEMNVTYADFLKIKDKLLQTMDADADSLRFYHLGNQWQGKTEHYGIKEGYNPEGLLLF